ncbi:MAG: hypothetical protein RLO51_16855 [Thalassobaculum sp.]|uniref:hypothetical protein n=1 Tax=Thalassobaculum sp. TaxID=2022740 RepID=UPI0032ED2633
MADMLTHRAELLDRLLATLLTVAEATAPDFPRRRRALLSRRMAGDAVGAWLHMAWEAAGQKQRFRAVLAARAAMASEGVADDADPAMPPTLGLSKTATQSAQLHAAEGVPEAKSHWLFLLSVHHHAILMALLANRYGDAAITLRAEDIRDEIAAQIPDAEAAASGDILSFPAPSV